MQQKAFAKVIEALKIRRLCSAVKHAKGQDAAAIDHFKKQAPIAFLGVCWLQHHHIGPAFHLASSMERRFVEVSNPLVGQGSGINSTGDSVTQHFVGARLTKGHATKQRFAAEAAGIIPAASARQRLGAAGKPQGRLMQTPEAGPGEP